MSIEAPPLERKLIAILAADVEGYSRLMHEDEERTLATLSSHRVVIDGLIEAAGGHITSTAGDSVLAEFASVVEAVVCAVEIQRSLAAANEPLAPDQRMAFRIGINVGDVMIKDGGIFGDGVNVAARIEALAPAGGVCVTRGVRDHVRDRLPYRFEDQGDHSVKNIARPIQVYQLIDEERPSTTEPEPPTGIALEPDGPSTAAGEPELLFWKAVQADDSPDEYQAYLDRFPAGTFAGLARSRLQESAQGRDEPQDDRAVELAYWDSVKDTGDPKQLEAYLEKYPNGEFQRLAEIRRDASEAPDGG